MPAPKKPIPLPCPLLRRFAVALGLAAAALVARADIAVLREKGPHSGSAFSNPGLIADAPAGLKVAMKTADVKIHLRPGDGDTLKADVTANFVLEDSSPAELAGQLYLVGFPVTGLSSKIVTIDNFAVMVDGKTPATVLRQCIGTHFRAMRAEDTPVNGKLTSQTINEKSPSAWSVQYEGKAGYRSSYIWQQSAVPAKTVKVHVTYSFTLHPQSIHYSKTYDREEDGDARIPFKTLNVDNWNDRHFFFDYVLRSGATWAGAIGEETILISVDPALGLNLREIIPMEFRRSEELERQKSNQEAAGYEPEENDLRASEQWKQDEPAHSVRFTLQNEDPEFDLLLAIPLSAIKRKQ